MEKVLEIVQLKDNRTDIAFWRTRSEKERLEAIEILRQQYINFRNDVQPGLQRVYRINAKQN